MSKDGRHFMDEAYDMGEAKNPAEIIRESLERMNRYKALSAVHTALDNATMARGVSEADIVRLSDMMKQIRTMKDHK